jgi:hypothetical protein
MEANPPNAAELVEANKANLAKKRAEAGKKGAAAKQTKQNGQQNQANTPANQANLPESEAKPAKKGFLQQAQEELTEWFNS